MTRLFSSCELSQYDYVKYTFFYGGRKWDNNGSVLTRTVELVPFELNDSSMIYCYISRFPSQPLLDFFSNVLFTFFVYCHVETF